MTLFIKNNKIASTNYDIQIVIDAQNKAQAELARISTQLKKIQDEAGNSGKSIVAYGNTLGGLKSRIDDAEKSLKGLEIGSKEYRKAQQELTKITKEYETQINNTGNRVKDFGKNNEATFRSMRNQGAVAFGALSVATTKFISDAMGSETVSLAFDRMANSIGQSSDKILSSLQAASMGTVSDSDLMLSANKAMALGVAKNTEDFSVLMEISRTKAKAMGLSTTQAFSDIVTGLGRASPLILDNLGITVKLGEVQEIYAQSLGKTVSQLTEAEKKQALINAVVSQGKEEMASMGEIVLDSSERRAILTAQLSNLSGTIGDTLLPIVEEVLTAVTPVIEATIGRIKENPQLTKTIVLVSIAVAGLVTVVGALGLALPAIAAGFALLAGPIGIAIGAVTALIAIGIALYKNRGKITKFGKSAWSVIKKSVVSAIDTVILYINKAIVWVNKFLSKIGLAIPELKRFEAESQNISKSQAKVGEVVGGVLGGIADKLSSITRNDVKEFGNKASAVMGKVAGNTKQVTKETKELAGVIGGGGGGSVNTKLEEQKGLLKEIEDIAKEKAKAEKQAYSEIQKAGQTAYDKISDSMKNSTSRIFDIKKEIDNLRGSMSKLGEDTSTSVAGEFVNIQNEVKKTGINIEEANSKMLKLQSDLANKEADIKTGEAGNNGQDQLLSIQEKITQEKQRQDELLAKQLDLQTQLDLAKENTTDENIARAEMIAGESGIERILREADEKKAKMREELEQLKSNKQQEIELLRNLHQQKIEFEKQYMRQLDITKDRQIANTNELIAKQRQYNLEKAGSYVPTSIGQTSNTTNNSFAVNMGGVNATIRENADIEKVADRLARKIQLNRQFNFD